MNSITETLTGIVSRVTYHNPDSGWSVLRVQPYNSPQQQETVTVHQTEDPYRLANDFYGMGFFSADKVALSIGLYTDTVSVKY